MQERISNIFFFATLTFLLYWGCRLLAPFGGPLICAIAAGVVFYPMHEKIKKWMPRWNESLSALASDFLVLVFLVLPTALLVWALIVEADKITPTLQEGVTRGIAWLKTNPSEHLPILQHLPDAALRQLDLRSSTVQDRIAGLGNKSLQIAAGLASSLATHTASAIFDTIIFLLVLFFVFRDGPELLERLVRLLPLDSRSKTRTINKMSLMILGVVRGTFLTALAQGAAAALGFLIIGTDAAILLGFLTAIASFIPSVGTTLVWIPVCIFYLATGAIGKGIFVAVWGIVVVGLVDNLLRPFIVGNKAEMPFIWLFFSMLGGIQLFGVLGIILGPMIFGLISVFLEIYEQKFHPAEAR